MTLDRARQTVEQTTANQTAFMQIVFHIGAHHTDEGALLRSLAKSRDELRELKVAVPDPDRYRRLIGENVNALRGEQGDQDTEDLILGAALDRDDVERVIFSNDSFICMRARTLETGELYTRVYKSVWLRNLFPQHEVDFALGIRNLATFLPALYAFLCRSGISYADFMEGSDPLELSWFNYVRKLSELNPHSIITVWCNEDTPFIWGEVLRSVTGTGDGIEFAGAYDILRTIMPRAGLFDLGDRIAQTPPADEAEHRRIMMEFAQRYAVREKIEIEIDLPGWTDDLVTRLTDSYDADLARIAALPNVELILP